MSSTMSAGTIEAELVYKEALKAALKDIVGYFLPGSALGVVFAEHVAFPFCTAWWNRLKGFQPSEQQEIITNISRMPVKKIREITEALLANTQLDAKTIKKLVNYFSALPMSTARAITRPSDEGTPTTLLTQLPRSSVELLRFLPQSDLRFQPDDKVPGHDYQLVTFLGQGGFAEVWMAKHVLRRNHPPVAIKFCLQPKLVASIKNEIQILDQLSDYSHPEDIVQLIGTAYHSDPPFLVYEYVDGGDLNSWLSDCDGNKPPSPDNVIRVLKMTARPLAYAHGKGIIHRDIKPSNILVTRTGRVKISDFGIGSVTLDPQKNSMESAALSGVSVLKSAHTPLYLDPGKRIGETASSAKDDVYALGVIAYQLLVGDTTRRIGADWRGELEAHKVPDPLLDVIAACVAHSSNRLPDAGALMEKLKDIDGIKSTVKTGRSAYAADHTKFSKRASFCSECGTKTQVGDKFCTTCGYQIV